MLVSVQTFRETVGWHLITWDVIDRCLAESNSVADPMVADSGMAAFRLIFAAIDIDNTGFVVIVDWNRFVLDRKSVV